MGVGANPVLTLPFIAAEAMTKYHAVKLNAVDQGVDLADTIGDACIGIVQETVSSDDATAGRIVAVAVSGTSVWQAGAAVSIGDRLRTAADGEAVALAATTANQEVVGIALTAAAAAGDWFTVLLLPGVTHETT